MTEDNQTVNSLVSLLRSSKIKDRNKALNDLEDFSLSNIQINSKGYRLLLQGICDLIESETISLLTNKTKPTEVRISRGANSLRLLVEKTLKDKSIRLKARAYSETVLNVIDKFARNDEVFYPSALDFAKTANVILSFQFFRDHLLRQEWDRIYWSLVNALDIILERSVKASYSIINEKLTAELFSALHGFLQCDKNISVMSTRLYDKNVYSKLVEILSKVIFVYKKESVLMTSVFRIVNKLILILGTEDIIKLKMLIRMGLRLSIAFHSSQLNSIQDQVLTFINLGAVHNFIDFRIESAPSKVLELSDSWQDRGNSDDESIRSDIPSLGFQQKEEVLDGEDLLYEMGATLQSVFNCFRTSDLELQSEDFGVDNSGAMMTIDWFSLRGVYLHSSKHKAWLLVRGLSKLLESYFRIKKHVIGNKASLLEPDELSFNSELAQKRRKLGGIIDVIRNSSDSIEFCHKLINDKSDSKHQKHGLLIFTFLFIASSKHEYTYFAKGSHPISDLSESSDIFEATSINNDSNVFDSSNSLEIILSSFDNYNLTFWSLLASREYLIASENQKSLNPNYHTLQKLMKISLPLVKDESLGWMASSVFFLTHLRFGQESTFETSLLMNISNLIDMPEINGPSMINEESILFWFSINSISRDAHLAQKRKLNIKIQDWLVAKWDISIRNAHNKTPLFDSLKQFIGWICGHTTEYNFGTSFRSSDSRFGEIWAFQAISSKLEDFECHQKDVSKETESRVLPIDMIEEDNLSESLYIKMIDTSKYFRSIEDEVSIFQWSLFLLHIQHVLSSKKHNRHLSTSISYQSTIDSKYFEMDDTLSSVSPDLIYEFNQLNFCILNPEELQAIHERFPLARILEGSFSLLKTDFQRLRTSSLNGRQHNGEQFLFEDEFSSDVFKGEDGTSSDNVLPFCSSIVKKTESVELIKFFTFISKLRQDDENQLIETIVFFLKEMQTVDLLYSFSYLNSQFDNKSILLENVNDANLTKLIRLLGEGPLIHTELDRCEFTLITVAQFLKLVLPIISDEPSYDLKNDLCDISTWLIQCGQKDVVQTYIAYKEFCEFLLVCQLNEVKLNLKGVDFISLYLERFLITGNSMKISLAPSLVLYLRRLTVENQMEIYKCLHQGFTDTEKSLEKSATYVLLFSELGQCSEHIMVTALFNLIQCSEEFYFKPYLLLAIGQLCNLRQCASPKELLKDIVLELLIYWFMFDQIKLFPYELFQYTNKNEFYIEFYKEITAISIAIVRTKDPGHILEDLSTVKSLDIGTLICDSLHMIVPLAYSQHGVRNGVFVVIKSFLNSNMKALMREKMFLIILKTIEFTDLSEERELLEMFENRSISLLLTSRNSSMSIGSTKAVSISLKSTLEIIEKLTNKYNSGEVFWEIRKTFFFVKRISIQLHRSTDFKSRISVLRRLKLLLLLSTDIIFSYELLKSLLNITFPLVHCEMIVGDALSILAFVAEKLGSLEHNISKPLIVKVLAGVLNFKDEDHYQLNSIHQILTTYKRSLSKNDQFVSILETVIDLLKSRSPKPLSSSCIESFLASENDFNICLLDGDAGYIVQVISEVFEYVDVHDEKGCLQPVVQTLLAVDYKSKRLKRKFAIWSAMYIASYYLHGGIKDGLSHLFKNNDFDGLIEDLNNEVQGMDVLIRNIERYVTDVDPIVSASAESVLGVLIQKYNRSKKDVLQYVKFEEQLIKYEKYLLPLDFHSCIILNSEDDSFEMPETSIADFVVKGLNSSNIHVDMWSSNLLVALFHDLSAYTTIASLISIFVIRVPCVARQLIPFTICYYLNFKGKEAIGSLSAIFDGLLKLSLIESEYADILIRSVLQLRIGVKCDLKYFQEIYESINLSEVFKIAVKNKFFRSSLLIFEDLNLNNVGSIDWSKYKEDLLIAYEAIDESDLFYGIPEEPSLDYSFQIIARSANTSDKIQFDLGSLDANLSMGSETSANKALSSMTEFGMYGISALLKETESSRIDYNDDELYERAWKLNKWNLISTKDFSENQIVYMALYNMREYPHQSKTLLADHILELLEKKEEVTSIVSDAKLFNKSAISWFKTIGILQCLYDLLNYDKDNYESQMNKFYEDSSWFDFAEAKTVEDVLLARKTAFQIFAERNIRLNSLENEQLWLGSVSDLVHYNNLVRNDGQKQKMISSMIMIDQIANNNNVNLSPSLKEEITKLSKFQTASSLWEQGQTSVPVIIVKDLIKSSGFKLPISSLSLHSHLLEAILVGWMADSRQDLAANLMDKYVTPTLPEIVNVENVEQRARTYRLFAQFCDSQSRSKSLNDEILKLERKVTKKKTEIEELKDHYGKTYVSAEEKKTVQKYYTNLKSQYVSEKLEYDTMNKQKEKFSSISVKLYLKSILYNDDVDEDLDRFFALWLEQSGLDDLNANLSEEILEMPTHKVINWSSQLISRLAANESKFQDLLRRLVIRICMDHPFHSLYHLISQKFQESMLSSSTTKKLEDTIWNRLLSQDKGYVQSILLPIENFCHQSVKLAEHKVSRAKSININSIDNSKFWLNELPRIPMPTDHVPVSKVADYGGISCMESVDPKIAIASSGLSLPKIATFTLSNGKKRKLLLKHGTDDLKQDAIMELVFDRVNTVLQKDKATRERNLKVRTYKALPLGPKAGIIEFVANSVALIEVIKPYHKANNEMKLERAKELMRKCQTSNRLKREQVFHEITDSITPVLKHFFLDNFLTPEKWIESKNLYTRGIATTSMIGHILGLGDRHCNNILLDQSTGEPIHIDLGVAFDQGKRLPIPETVPFRLTRDIVDGFGVVGTNGVFAKSCEHTFRVLRENRDHILSILDVLRWDPLYSWSISPLRKKKLQSSVIELNMPQYEEDGSEAGRSIATVSDKLSAGGLSVEANVRELIQEATNPQNLALIYFGWCPFY